MPKKLILNKLPAEGIDDFFRRFLGGNRAANGVAEIGAGDGDGFGGWARGTSARAPSAHNAGGFKPQPSSHSLPKTSRGEPNAASRPLSITAA
jgi:hypothetical protein